MKWPTFVVFAIICVVLQTTVAPHLAVGRVRPDWLLVLAAFFAMHVRGLDVILAGCILGLIADLETIEGFGLLAIAYAAATGLVYAVRAHVFRSHPLAHLAVTFVAGLVVQFIMLLHTMIFTGVGGGTYGAQIFGGIMIALYTALWAPPIHAALLWLSPHVGIDVPRYTQVRFG
ncbi:MAG: rod shape-determining protein MreD [Phycisphaerales bacterium]|nr:rod shape-determining protein MreD [Phycisphaerales bacterium]